ncbi:MAG: RNA-binding domain-containing protein, partial [Bacteroidota bacterium]
TDVFQNKIRLRDIVEALEQKSGGERLSRETENLIDDNIRLIERIKDREFVEQIIPTRASIKEAIDIFYIVNASGVNLTDAELALAQISGYWPQARARIKEKLSKLEMDGWVLNLDFMMYVLLGVMHNSGSKMEKLHTVDNMPRLIDVWNELDQKTLDYVFNLMKTHAFIDHSKEINSVYALIPIIVFAFNKGKTPMTQQEIKKAIKWFYYSQIRQRYISQLPQKLDKDLRIVSSENTPFDKLISLIEVERKLEIDKDEFIGVGVSHPLWGLMKWYFKSKNAVCLSTGISIRKNMGKKYELEYDHIFPYSVLAEHGYDLNNRVKYSLAQEITNRAVLTSIGNRSKYVKSAEGYLKEVQQNFPNCIALQCIPDDEELWKLENYEKFLEARRKLLAKELNTFLDGLTKIHEEEVTMDVYDLIQAGENNEVEFKTTLRYDIKQNTVNKKLENVVLKTIAAFSNGQGGTLIIGVNDDMEIVGLENDYSTIKEGSKDGFEIHLRNLINKAYGVEFASTLKITFPVIMDTEICCVEIQPGKKPLFTEVIEDTGIKSEKFYLRSGNSSPELPIREIPTYIRSRFDNYFA